MIVASDPFKSAPRISRATFRTVMKQRAAAAVIVERDPGEYWDAIKTLTVDPLFLLAMFNHESTMGKAGIAQQTHSWGNTRDPSFGATPVDEVAGRSGTFPVFRNWLDGCISTAARLVTDKWVYHDRTSILEIFDHPSGDVWAPAGDMNDPAGYVRAVLDFMNQYADQGVPPMADDGRDSRFAWTPDTSEFGYPADPNAPNPGGIHGRNGQPIELLILHITAGTDSQSWLLGGNGSSTHYLTHQDGTPRAQHVADADAAWTPGSRAYAERSINVEVEMLHVTDWTDAIMRETARTIAPIMARHSVPAVYLGRANGPGKRGMIGHRDVPNPIDPSDAHYCGPWGGSGCHNDPGAGFDWTTFTGYVAAELAGGSQPPTPATPPRPPNVGDPDARYVPETGHWLQFGFRAFWDANGGLPVFGYPLTEEVQENGQTCQYFERAVFEWHDAAGVLLRRLGAEAARAAGYSGAGI
jgi:hypothetical protein